MVRLFGRRKTYVPVRHTHDSPQWPGAWLFTLRTVPRHYDALKATIESTGDARVWFGEALAYIHGKGIALLRVEATGFRWVEPLCQRWGEIERREAFPFEIELYIRNTQWVATLRDHTPAEVERIVREHAPTYQS